MLFSEDIVEKNFTKVFRGYDVQEVDLFLDDVIRTLEEHERERDLLLSRVEALLERLEQATAPDGTRTAAGEEPALLREPHLAAEETQNSVLAGEE